MRIVKNPEERRKEIMDAAASFFLTKGYEETSVNTIVEYLNIAKGTFYHYFKSKEEILAAILEDYLEQYAEKVRNMISSTELTAHDKMQYLLRGLIVENGGADHLTQHIEDSSSGKLHQMMDEKFIQKFYPIIVNVIKQGIEEGMFQVSYPEEITEILLMGIRAYMHIHLPNFKDEKYAKVKVAALEELFNKILSIKDEEFRIILMKQN